MAALAIDVVTLYVARSEMQRAADAAALAAAKAFVDSGVTSLTRPTATTRQTAGSDHGHDSDQLHPGAEQSFRRTPPVGGGTPAFDFTRPGNPQMTVTLQRTDLPTFFSRIWGTSLATVTASAVAEAYNPCAMRLPGYSPIAPKCVKPLLVANQDPKSATLHEFVDPATGSADRYRRWSGESGLITPCTGRMSTGIAGQLLQFRPAQVCSRNCESLPRHVCTPPASDYETSIECCDSANPPATQYMCGNAGPDTTGEH